MSVYNKIKNFFIKSKDGEESNWLYTEQVNIFITAIIPAIISFAGVVVTYFTNRGDGLSHAMELMQDPSFINGMQLIVIICTLIVIYRIRRSMLVTKEKEQRLFVYIREQCNLRDQSTRNVKKTSNVVKKTMSQFYTLWISLWVVFFFYYSGSLGFSLLDNVHFCFQDEVSQEILKNVFSNTFNFLSSTVMLGLFLVLNSVTVSTSERKTGRFGKMSIAFIIALFGCAILIPSYYSISLRELSYFKLQLIISLILGIYSALSFVLFLGKLNTNLQIPRFMFYWLYIYALVQMLEFLLTPRYGASSILSGCCGFVSEIAKYLEIVDVVFLYVTFIGKIFLSLTILWIVYDTKFMNFVLRQSLAITELPYRMSIFRKYMQGTD